MDASHILLCLCVLMLANWAVCLQNPYCKFTPQHTMCRFQGKGVGRSCGRQVSRQGLTAEERADVVLIHNELRDIVAEGRQPGQPSASNMKEMEWDDELAKLAQTLVDQCKFKHDCNKCRNVDRFSVGQNLYISGSTRRTTTADWTTAIRSWYAEVKDFNTNEIKPYKFTRATAHYTQLVWADTNKIGCGFIAYKQGMWWRRLYACNYGPSGNIITGTMYERGSAASKCDGRPSRKYKGLCAP